MAPTFLDPGWSMTVAVVSLFMVVEPLRGYVFEPLLDRHLTGPSPLSIIISAIFWPGLWRSIRVPAARIVVGLWPQGEAALSDAAIQRTIGSDRYAGSLAQAVDAIVEEAAATPGGRKMASGG